MIRKQEAHKTNGPIINGPTIKAPCSLFITGGGVDDLWGEKYFMTILILSEYTFSLQFPTIFINIYFVHHYITS